MQVWFKASLRILFVVCIAYPVVLLWLGIHVRHRERLPRKGPAIVAANHNSHLDILTLLSLFSLLTIPNVQPAAAADYFFKNPFIKWFSLNVVGIIPVVRGGAREGADPLEDCYRALEAGKILVIFPEGTRGEPEQMAELKSGIWYLSRRFPQAPVIPVFMHGLGKSMPKGTLIPIPFFIHVGIGKALYGTEDKTAFMEDLKERMRLLKQKTSPTHDTEVL
jgi:1-acyl-sn-glycerol-3-phosphate acyltransferase